MVVSQDILSNQTSQQVTEPNIRNSMINTVAKSYTSTREIIHDVTPVKDVITKVKLIIEYSCEDGEILQAIIDLPMSKFMDDDHDLKDNFNEIVALYLKKSVLFIKKTTSEERGNIHQAIDYKDYTISGVVLGKSNDVNHVYIDNGTNEYVPDHFHNAINMEGGYEKCEFITFIINFPILAVNNHCHVASPFRDDPPIQSQHHMSESPTVNDTPASLLSPTPIASMQNRFAVLTVDDDEEEETNSPIVESAPSSVLQATAPAYNNAWRTSPTPKGPWKHNSVVTSTPIESVQHDMINSAAVERNHSTHSSTLHPSYTDRPTPHQPTYMTPAVSPPYAAPPSMTTTSYIPDLQTFDMTEYSIVNAPQYCQTLNNTKMDLKQFIKKEYVPVQSTGTILNWYRRFTGHALRCGVFVPPFESLIPSEELGMWVGGIDPSIIAQIPQMSSAIHAVIVNSQAIPQGPAFTEFLNETCGYTALHDLMRDVHPRLSIHTLVYDRPKCRTQEHVSDYIVRWKEYLLIEHESGRLWRRHDVAKHIINNLPKENRLWIKSQFDALMLSKPPHLDVPPAFHMKHISKTISSLIPLNPHPPPAHHSQHHHRTTHTLMSMPHASDDVACTACSQSHATIVHSVDGDTQELTQAIGGQFDSGANMNTTNHLSLLWNVHKLKSPRYTLDAGQNRHTSRYRGYLVLPCTRHGQIGYIAIATYYTPTIGVTLIAPSAIREQYPSVHSWTISDSNNLASTTFYDRTAKAIFAMSLYAHNSLHWTAPFIRPSIHQRENGLPKNFTMSVATSGFIDTIDHPSDNTLVDDWSEFARDDTSPYADENVSHVHPLHSRTLYQIWHQRLGHIQPRTITELHKHVDGVPTLPTPTLLDNCPICISSKMRRADSSSTDSREATQCHQSLSIDMAFIVQKSKNSDRYIANVGLKGETCYVLITDYFSGMVHGKALVNKGPPIEYFNQWLARFNPDITNKTVRFDQGGELGRCRRVLKLFQDFGYTIQLTGADSSHQNGSVERSHQSIGNMVRSLLHGASLERKFWPFAFYHALFLMNRFPHHKKPSPPITICSGRRVSLESLRVFGCRIYVRLPGERRAKLDHHTSVGIFLGYNETMKNIFWFDPATAQIKTASHVRFDEGMADVPNPPPNVQLLQRVEHDNILPDAHELSINPVEFQFDASPFRTIDTITITILCDSDTFGFVYRECHIRHRAYISDILPNTSASRIRNARHKYIGAFVVQIHNTPVYDLTDAITATALVKNDPSVTTFDMLLAPDKYIPVRSRREPLRINAAQLHAITTLRLESMAPPAITHSIAAAPVSSLQPITPITPDETRLKDRLTRPQLRKLSTWPLWRLAEHKQLDAHHLQDMFGDPITPPDAAIILHPHWRYKIKLDGTRSARECCDGSPRAAPALHHDAITYASCIELPCMRLFFSMAAINNHVVLLTDAVNAYANARGPTIPTYIRVDDAFIDWYHTRFQITLHRGMVVQAKHALQGHPEAGKLFEELANDILLNRIGLTTTSHERNLYCGTFDGHPVYVCRQVDDLAIAAPTIDIGQNLIAAIGSHVTLAGNSLLTKFNGVQVEQSKQYIRIYSTDYIDRLLARHGWVTPSTTDDCPSFTKEPMSSPTYKQIDSEVGPPEHSSEGIALTHASGFSYRQLLGELIYVYVTCRLDIGFALTKLAQYSQHPAPIHFNALKHVALYLRSTKSWGIMYWRPHILPSLPDGCIDALPVPTDPSLPSFPIDHYPDQLVAYVDASHGTDQARRSVTGYVLSFCGGAICYRSKVQVATALSSTEAELVASVMCAKAVKYIRSVLADLDFPQHDPTPIYEDNAASILIVNASKPTPRTRHIDIQFFAVQQWKALGHILLLAIAGVINVADALTKALGWMLHHRHTRRAMGHHAQQYKTPAPSL